MNVNKRPKIPYIYEGINMTTSKLIISLPLGIKKRGANLAPLN